MQCELYVLARTCGRRWRPHDEDEADEVFRKMSVVVELFELSACGATSRKR